MVIDHSSCGLLSKRLYRFLYRVLYYLLRFFITYSMKKEKGVIKLQKSYFEFCYLNKKSKI